MSLRNGRVFLIAYIFLVSVILCAKILVHDNSTTQQISLKWASPSIAQHLADIADSATYEHVWCLYGRMYDHRVIIESATEAEILSINAEYIHSGSVDVHTTIKACDLRKTVAVWHNHIAKVAAAHNYGYEGFMVSAEPAPVDVKKACYLSGVDMRTTLAPYSPPVAIVSVNRQTMCWWTKDQIRARDHSDNPRIEGNLLALPSIAGQRTPKD